MTALILAGNRVGDLEDQLSFLNGSIAEAEKGLNKLNDSADYLQSQGMARLTEAVEKENAAIKKATHTLLADSKKLGEDYTLGISEGMDAKRSVLFDRAKRLMKDTVNVMKDAGQIHSPSKLTENLIGKNLALGVIKGWNDVFDGNLRNSFSLNGAFGAMGSTTNTMNLGGVSVNVYAQEGQDANAIANIVMKKMQGAVDARKAVFA